MFTTAYRDAILDVMDGATLTTWSPFLGLFTAISDLRAGTVTEANYTGYGTRPAISFGAAAATSPVGGRQKANDVAVTFPQNTGADQACIGWSIHTAATAGTLRIFGFIDADPPFVGVGEPTGDTISAFAHGLQTDQRVFVLAAPGAIIPTGLAENTAYFVRATGLTADSFSLAATSGGAALNMTVGGASLFIPYTPVTVATNATPEFAIGSVVVQI